MNGRRQELDIYGGRDPREIPTYTTVEAAHYFARSRADHSEAGDSFELLAGEYGRPIAEIEEAIRCELAFDAA